MNRLVATLISLPILVLGISCAPTKPTTSNFLQNTTQLQLDGKTRRYVNPKLSQVDLKQVYIEPVKLELPKEVFKEEQRAELVAYYTTELQNAFGQEGYKVVGAPSSDAYTVRSAITGLNGSSIVTNVILSIVAIPLDNGGASVETEILEGKSKERLYAEARSLAGGFIGVGSFSSRVFGYISRTNHSKAALKTAARDLVKVLPGSSEAER